MQIYNIQGNTTKVKELSNIFSCIQHFFTMLRSNLHIYTVLIKGRSRDHVCISITAMTITSSKSPPVFRWEVNVPTWIWSQWRGLMALFLRSEMRGMVRRNWSTLALLVSRISQFLSWNIAVYMWYCATNDKKFALHKIAATIVLKKNHDYMYICKGERCLS